MQAACLADLMVFREEDVPSSNVTMNKPLSGEIVQSSSYLAAVAQQGVGHTGVHLPSIPTVDDST